MPQTLDQLLADLGSGKITRRHLLQALGVAAVAAPVAAFGQGTAGGGAGTTGTAAGGGGGGRGGRGGAPRDTTPLVPPFAPTGWKTVWLDHFSYHCADYKKAAAYYSTLMGWKVRSDDGKQAMLDIGDNSGGMLIRGGFAGPAPAALTDAQSRGGPPHQAVFDGFCWGIEPWDTKTVEAELKKRGLNPVADHSGKDFQSFHVKDPDGFDLQISNGTKALRRKTPATGKLPAPAPFEPTGWNTLFVDHISFEVVDYKRTVAFYAALLGWTPGGLQGTSSTCKIGDVAGTIIRQGSYAPQTPRGGGGGGGGRGRGGAAGDSSGRAAAAAAPPPPPPPPPVSPTGVTAVIGHISFGIQNWDTEKVRTELAKRGLGYPNRTTQVVEPLADMSGTLESFHVPDAQGWDLQIGNKIAP